MQRRMIHRHRGGRRVSDRLFFLCRWTANRRQRGQLRSRRMMSEFRRFRRNFSKRMPEREEMRVKVRRRIVSLRSKGSVFCCSRIFFDSVSIINLQLFVQIIFDRWTSDGLRIRLTESWTHLSDLSRESRTRLPLLLLLRLRGPISKRNRNRRGERAEEIVYLFIQECCFFLRIIWFSKKK